MQKLGEQLVALSSEQLAGIELADELRNAVIEAGKIKAHEARRRQLQRIGALMRAIDPQPIQSALENIRLGDHQKNLAFKKIEKWRDELKQGNLALIEEILDNCPDAERRAHFEPISQAMALLFDVQDSIYEEYPNLQPEHD